MCLGESTDGADEGATKVLLLDHEELGKRDQDTYNKDVCAIMEVCCWELKTSSKYRWWLTVPTTRGDGAARQHRRTAVCLGESTHGADEGAANLLLLDNEELRKIIRTPAN